jgi:hypothetical protein
MTQVTTVTGRVHNFDGYNWTISTEGTLIVKTGPSDFKSVFAAGQWESVKELGK